MFYVEDNISNLIFRIAMYTLEGKHRLSEFSSLEGRYIHCDGNEE